MNRHAPKLTGVLVAALLVVNGVQAKGGSADTLIHGNVFTDIPGRAVNAGGSTGLAFFRPMDAPHEAANIRIVANIFVRVGADSGANVAYVGCDTCVFANNTVIEPRTWVARILHRRTARKAWNMRMAYGRKPAHVADHPRGTGRGPGPGGGPGGSGDGRQRSKPNAPTRHND